MALTQPIADLATDIGAISSSIDPAATGIGALATNTGTLATNATNANPPMEGLNISVIAVGLQRLEKNGAIAEFVGIHSRPCAERPSAAMLAVAGLGGGDQFSSIQRSADYDDRA